MAGGTRGVRPVLPWRPSKVRVAGLGQPLPGARSAVLRSLSSLISLGLGTLAVTGATWPGLVPQVTCGEISAALKTRDLSYFAPASVGSSFQRATALSKSAPLGANSRPFT